MMRLSEFLRVLVRLVVAVTVMGVVGLSLGRAVPALTRQTGPVVRAARVIRALTPRTLPPLLGASVEVRWQVGKVVRVVDGDTYDLSLDGQAVRVRLLGVDAPEHDQPFGGQASDSVRRVLGQYVLVSGRGNDLYGRTLAAVQLRPGAFSAAPSVALDSLLVVRGLAWAFEPGRAHARREPEQAAAQRAGLGLWKCGTVGPVAPKVWRGYSAQEKAAAGVGCPW